MSEIGEFAIAGVTFNATSGELSAPAATRRLEPKAAAVLAILCTRRGQVVTRHELLDRCWGDGEGSDEALTQAVSQIRRSLQDLGAPSGLLETLAKRGYRLSGDNVPIQAQREAPAINRNPPLPIAIGGLVLVALIIAVVAFPHGLRHSIRHGLGLGPPAAGSTGH